MTRLDRFLLLERLISNMSIVYQVVGKKKVSDHKHIWVKSNNVNWGPKPFKIFNCWFDHPNFDYFVEGVWNSIKFHGKNAFVMKGKLDFLRVNLRKCNVEVFGMINLEVEVATIKPKFLVYFIL